MTDRDAIAYSLRRCHVEKANLRLSFGVPRGEATWRAVVLESVRVHESVRRQGVFARFLGRLIETPDTDLFVVEGVQNPVLADYLLRLGWGCDPGVMDFYLFPDPKGS